MKIKFLLFCTVLLLCFTSRSSAVVLKDVRTGFHGSFSRIVIELDRPVKYQVIKDVESRKLLVDLHAVDTIAPFGQVELEENDAFLKRVSYYRTRNVITISIDLLSSDIRVKSYRFEGPFRIIIDIARGQSKAVSSDAKKSATNPSQNVKADAVGKTVGIGSAIHIPQHDKSDVNSLLDSTLAILKSEHLPVDLMLNRRKQQARPQKMKPSQSPVHEASGAILFYGFFALFLVTDVILFLWFQKRRYVKTKLVYKKNRRGGLRRQVAGNIIPVNNKGFVDVLEEALKDRKMTSSKVGDKTKSALQAVKISTLDDVLEPSQKDELAEINSAVKIDHFIASLSQVVETAEVQPVSVPDLSDVAHDLDAISASTHISKELSREQIMGKDGADFVKNIKRLYMG